jgi:proline dehydrogenase
LIKYTSHITFAARKESDLGVFTFLARRFIAGENKEEAFNAVRKLNTVGMRTTLDILGENVNSGEMARNLADLYIDLVESIHREKVAANVSLKLTQMGLNVSDDFCYKNVSRIIEAAGKNDMFVRIDMEGSDYTERTLRLVHRWSEDYTNVGAVIQASLYRSEADIMELIRRRIKVRLCKGAYKEPASIAFRRKDDVNANYIKLMKLLLDSGIFHSIATHDDAMITATKEYALLKGISKGRFEFQMLYGINRAAQLALVREDYGMLIYVPFGTHWFPYYYRRLRERKENILFIAKHLFKD